MADQKLATDRAKIQTELNIALLSPPEFNDPALTECTENEEILFATCIAGDSQNLEELLKDEPFLVTAIEPRRRRFGAYIKDKSNLTAMISMAIRGGSAQTTRLVLATAKRHNITLGQNLIFSSTVDDAVECGNIDVLKEVALACPESLNFGEDKTGFPMCGIVGRSRWSWKKLPLWSEQKEFEYLKVMLENGADPNGEGLMVHWPGYYLQAAAEYSPVNITKLLIQFGAQVPQSDALQTAVAHNRVDVLEVLLQHGADVNERPTEARDALVYQDLDGDDNEKKQQLSMVPLHYGVQANAHEATAWLLQHGADKNIQDARNKSPADYVREKGDKRMREIFGFE
jgi:hypothetical protein